MCGEKKKTNLVSLNLSTIFVAGIHQAKTKELLKRIKQAGIEVEEEYVFAPYGEYGGVIEAAGQYIGIASPYRDFQNLAGKHVGTVYTFSGGEAAFKRAASYYNITYDKIITSESPGSGEVRRHMSHGGWLQYIVPAIPGINEERKRIEIKLKFSF